MARIKVGIISILGILLLIGGIIMFRGVINNKQVFETDLYSFLPSDISSIVQINKEKDVKNIIPYIDSLSVVINEIKSSINYPIIIAQYEDCNYLVIKTTSSQEIEIKKILDTKLYSSYPPKEIKYKDAVILVYTTSNDNIFVCTFYNNIFIGGFNIGLPQQYIDNKTDNIDGIGNSPLGKEIIETIKTQYKANLFLNNGNSLSVFNINFDSLNIDMNGYNTEPNRNYWSNKNEADTLKLDYSIFPDSVIAYKIEMDNPIIVNDTMISLFSKPSYTFYFKDKSELIYALKHTYDKFYIYNMLNKLEKKFTGKEFDINDFHLGYRIYTTSTDIGKSIFGIEKPFYLLFYKDYLIFSENKNSLITYLGHNGKYNNKFITNQKEQPLNSLIFSENLKQWHPHFFNPNNIITDLYHKNIYMTSVISNKKKMYNIYINK